MADSFYSSQYIPFSKLSKRYTFALHLLKFFRQMLAGALLDAESKMGELLKEIPNKKATSGSGSRSLPEGITHKQSHYCQTLANNKEIVEQVKTEAMKCGIK